MNSRPPRFRAKVYAYHVGGWRWAYTVTDTRPLDGGPPREAVGVGRIANRSGG